MFVLVLLLSGVMWRHVHAEAVQAQASLSCSAAGAPTGLLALGDVDGGGSEPKARYYISLSDII